MLDWVSHRPTHRASPRVYGKTHPHLGEIVEAELVMNSVSGNLDSVRGYCRDHLASYKIPMKFTIVAELPRTTTGKIKRVVEITAG